MKTSRWIGREETTASSPELFPNSGSKVLSLLDFPRPVWPCHRDSGIGLGTFPLLGLLEFCQLAYLQY